MEGSNAVYKCELMGANTQGVPAERLLAGERFSVEEIRGERIDDKNFKYSMVRLPKNKKKNKKDEMDIAAELNRRLGNR